MRKWIRDSLLGTLSGALVGRVVVDIHPFIWPNALSQDTFVEKMTTVEFPPQDLRARGLHLRVDVPEG